MHFCSLGIQVVQWLWRPIFGVPLAGKDFTLTFRRWSVLACSSYTKTHSTQISTVL